MITTKLSELLMEIVDGVEIGRCINCRAMFLNVPEGTEGVKCSECGQPSVCSDHKL